jgi:hypothetical protein
MLYRLLGDALVLLHVGFVAFVGVGAVLVLRRPWVALLHLPSALWAVLISFYGGTCPLTPLEKSLRTMGGQIAYSGGFVEHYLLPVLYPAGLTRDLQVLLGMVVLAWSAAAYALVLRRLRRRDPESVVGSGDLFGRSA